MFIKEFKSSNFLAMLFGMVMILIIFGDGVAPNVGNLDTIFGQSAWPFMDVLYPIASIIIFLFYGKLRGSIKINAKTVWPFILFLLVAISIQLDDFFHVLNHPIILSNIYWTIVMWIYFFVASYAFLAFGGACENNKLQSQIRNSASK